MSIRVALVLLAVLVAAGAEAAPLKSSAFLTNGTRGEELLQTVAKDLKRVSVFAYHITEEGGIVPASSWVPDTVDQQMAEPGGPKIYVTVNNRVIAPDGTLSPEHGGDVVQAILADPVKREEHIRQLAELSQTAKGLELNYERFRPEVRDAFTAFIRDLRAAMPSDRKLSIVLQPKLNNTIGENGNAIDWRAIEPYANKIRIMAYYYSYSTSEHGPAVPKATLEQLASYALTDPEQGIPPNKLSIILSLWGWDWPMPVGTPGTLVQFSEAKATAEAHGVTPQRDPVESTLNFRYPGADGAEHEVWIDDFQSIRERIELLEAAGVRRVDFWNINTGDPALWSYIAARTAEAAK
jgi:spore germination protein